MSRYLLSAATILFGALPATFLTFLVVFVTVIGGGGLVDGLVHADIVGVFFGLVVLVWSLLALWGTYGLWAAAIGPAPVDGATAASLVGGIVAIVSAIIMFDIDTYDINVLGIPLIFPVAVALWHIWKWRAAGLDRSGNTQP